VIRIAVDAMGGDRGPAEIVAGALEARSDAIEPILFGDPSIDPHGLELRKTTEVIGMHEKPAEAVRGKPGS
jgi:glycerol-3-phosphate acyltransferase PlsX